ncbi:G-rich sequence factor 1 [Salminus brasiliensis]|uniref:G-rich sequence factor 1 n=1 Tax=Salminus brasiliensis TaxID=930266 RepID=UPI003B834536
MAVCSRTALIWSLLRGPGASLAPALRRATSTAVCGGRADSAQFTAWRERRTWVTGPALNLHTSTLTWTSQRRSLCSEAPEKHEYPSLTDYCADANKDLFVIRVKGLPYSCTADDLLNFFSDCQIRGGVSGIHLMQNKYGQSNGEAFIELQHERDIGKALEKDRQYLGPRYIEVYEITNNDADAILKGTEDKCEDGVVKLVGLPFNCTEEDVRQFFSGLDIAEGGVTFAANRKGRSLGMAFVQFTTPEMADQALKRDRELIGHRYIEVFPSKKSAIWVQHNSRDGEATVYKMTNNDADAKLKGTEDKCEDGVVKLVGLPFNCTEEDVRQFFSGLDIAEGGVTFAANRRGRSLGMAFVQFTTPDMADQALKRDRELIGHRYIKVFPSKKSAIWAQHGRRDRVSTANSLPTHFVHMRGIPFQATAEDIVDFFYPIRVFKILIEFGSRGQPLGLADVYFTSHCDAVSAMVNDKRYFANRRVELFLNAEE